MTTLQALALVALTVWIAPVALIFAWVLRDRSHDEQAVRETTPERPALPQRRPTDCTPIYDALACARIEKEEGWV